MTVVDFDESSHTYTLDGVIVPSVTQIIRPIAPDLSFVDADVLERASEFGKAVHKACELDDLDDLDIDALDPALAPYVNAWRQFRLDCQFVVEYNERIVTSPLHRYAGKLDRLGVMQKRRTLVDIKTCTTVHRVTGVQLAGYARAAIDCRLLGTGARPLRVAVQLKSDGTYDMKLFDDDSDHAAFLACLNLYQWRAHNAN